MSNADQHALLVNGDEADEVVVSQSTSMSFCSPLPIMVGALVVSLGVAAIAAEYSDGSSSPGSGTPDPNPNPPRNVIMMIPDGTGPATMTMARECKKVLGFPELNLDEILLGTAHTYSNDSLVTDSAASATAYSTGYKIQNNEVAVDINNLPIGTVMEAAKAQRGMTVGAIVTSRITHATPASYTAHINDRFDEDGIAFQQANADVDFMFGGGRRHFDSRSDNLPLLQDLEAGGAQVLRTRADFDAFVADETQSPWPTWGLLAASHMAYEVDRQYTDEPSLSEVVAAVLSKLEDEAENGNGFFVLIEGSKVDLAGHDNDAVTHAHEVVAYDDTVGVAKDFARRHPSTLLISVADHETGGLSLGNEYEYRWEPQVLMDVQASEETHATMMLDLAEINEATVGAKFTEVTGGLVGNATEITELTNRVLSGDVVATKDYISLMIDERSRIGWSTVGHSGVDVNVYGMGPAEWLPRLAGGKENVNIAGVVSDYLGLDLPKMTEELRANWPLPNMPAPAARKARDHNHHHD